MEHEIISLYALGTNYAGGICDHLKQQVNRLRLPLLGIAAILDRILSEIK